MKSRASYHRERHQRLLAEGRCVRCGGAPRDGLTTCDPCAKRQNAASRRYFQRVLEASKVNSGNP